jgi:hypothetical protein
MTVLDASGSEASEEFTTPQLTIEMCGRNIVVRPTAAIDEGYALALAGAVNAAAATDTVVIIDPDPVRCD